MQKLWLTLPLTVAFVGASCGGGYVGYSTYGDASADIAPPDPLVEVIPPRPSSSYAWINGYWYWNGDEYTWTRGRWAPRPGPDYAWVPHGWVRYGGQYRFYPGRWAHRGYAPHVSYVHPYPRAQYGSRYYVMSRQRPPAYAQVPRQYYAARFGRSYYGPGGQVVVR